MEMVLKSRESGSWSLNNKIVNRMKYFDGDNVRLNLKRVVLAFEIMALERQPRIDPSLPS